MDPERPAYIDRKLKKGISVSELTQPRLRLNAESTTCGQEAGHF